MSPVDHSSVNVGDTTLNCDIFTFLQETIPSVVSRNQRDTPVRLTCFDVSSSDLVVGSNVGFIFSYKRRTAIAHRPHHSRQIFTTAISLVKTTKTPGLILVTSYSTVVLWSLYDSKEIWRINLLPVDSVHPSDPKPYVTCLDIIKDDHESHDHLSLYTGLSNGHVIKVSVSPDNGESCQLQLKTVFIETDDSVTLDHLNHKIVQLGVIGPDSLLISTCYRTVILDNCSSERCVIQVGKNQRSTCASYGACYVDSENAIFASRPSSHLLVANRSSGSGEKTFILKRLNKPPSIEAFDKLRVPNGQVLPASYPFILGRLTSIDSSKIISWNKTSFYMLSTSGELLIDERNVDILGTCVVHSCDETTTNELTERFEIFILSAQMVLLRMINFVYDDDDVKSFLSSSSCSHSETDHISTDDETVIESFLPATFASTLNTFLSGLRNDGELNKRSNSLHSDLNNVTNSLCENTMNTGESVIVTRRKVSKSSKLKLNSTRVKSNPVTNSITSDRTNKMNEITTDNVSATNTNLYFSLAQDEDGKRSLQETSVDESERLLQILRAYNAGTSKKHHDSDDSLTSLPPLPTQVTQQDDTSSVPLTAHSGQPEPTDEMYPDVEEKTTDNSNDHPPVAPEKVNLNELLVFSPFALSANGLTTDSSFKKSERYDQVFLSWLQHSPQDKNVALDLSKVTDICAVQDETRDAVALLVDSSSKNWFIHIYPGGKKIKCPASQSRIRSFHVSCNQITLLYQDGVIYTAIDWLKKSLFCLGPKFIKMQYKRCNCFIDISCNILDRITWTCDQEGLAWILRSTECAPIVARDTSSPQLRLTTVKVSPSNSAIVWAVDQFSRLFVRCGIYNEKGESDSLIGGINWLLVDDLPGRVGVISVSCDAIWLVSEIEGKSHLYKRLGIEPPTNYIGTEWQEYSLPVDEKVRFISGNCR